MMLTSLFLVFTFQGVGSDVEFTCGGCQSEENSPEYFCSGEHRYLYFRCEGSGSSSLMWNVSSQDQEERVILGSYSLQENTIRCGNITVYVDTIDFTNGKSQIISYLWLNLGLVNSDVNVSCTSGNVKMKTLKQLESVQPPNSGKAAVYMNPTNERVVFYEWSHENPDTVLHYNIKMHIDGTHIYTITLPSGTVNGSTIVGEGTLHLDIEAVGLCGHTATYTIDVFQNFHPTEDRNRSTTVTNTDQCDSKNEGSHSMTIVAAVVPTAVVSGVVCFIAGLLFAFGRFRKKIDKNDAENLAAQSSKADDEIKNDFSRTNNENLSTTYNDSNKDPEDCCMKEDNQDPN